MFGGEWSRNVLRILRQGACPLLKCRVEKKTKVKRYKRHDTSVLVQITGIHSKTQYSTLQGSMRDKVPHVWGRIDPQLRILRQGACPLLKCRVEKKTKVKRYKRHDTSVLVQITGIHSKTQYSTLQGSMRDKVPHVWGRIDPQLRILRQGACPLLKESSREKNKNKRI